MPKRRSPGSAGSLVLRRREMERLRLKNDAARMTMGPRDERSILALGAIAYWCEGAKDKIYRRNERVSFCNSDPALIRLFKDWLTLVGVAQERLVFNLYIHETGDVAGAEKFWSDVRQISPKRLGRTTLKQSQPRTNRLNRGDRYHGVLVIGVNQSKERYQQIEGWMRGAADSLAVAVAAKASDVQPPDVDSLEASGNAGRSAVG